MTDWRLAWTFARRELDARFRGLRLLLVCLILGVGALAAIGSLTRSITGELAARGQSLLGGDLELSVSQRPADPAERRAMAKLGRVSETLRMQSMGVNFDGQTAPIELKAVDTAYPLYGTLTLQNGAARPLSPTETYVGPALVERLKLRVGGSVRYGTACFTVAGIIADEPDRLSEGFTLGAVALVSLDGLQRTGLIAPGSLYESKYRIASRYDPAQAIAAFTKRYPAQGWDSRTRDRASPGAERFLTRMGEFLVLVGLTALVIAGIGVGNGVSSYLATRRSSIATLKVLGATSGLIARVYLLQIVAVSAIGIAIGLAIGIAAVPLIVALAGDVLPVAPAFAIHPLPLVQAAAYGLLIALAFAAPPLLAAGAVPAAGLLRGVHDGRSAPRWKAAAWMGAAFAGIVALVLATSERPWFGAAFLGAAGGLLLLLSALGWLIRRLAARLPRSRRPLWRLAVAALHRPGARTGALVVALGLGLTLFVLLAAIRTSLDANIQRTVPARAPALFALDVPPTRESSFRDTIANIQPDGDVQTVPLMRGTITAYGTTRVADLKTIPEGAWALRGERGLTFAATLPPGSELVAGTWWPADYTGPPLVSVDERMAQALDLKLGDPLTISVAGQERTARIASLRKIAWDTMGFNFVMVFSPNALSDVPHNLAATITMPPGRERDVVRALSAGFPSTSVVEVREVIGQVRTIVSQMATAIAAAAGIAILAGIAVLVGAIAAARETRTYDSVILKTLGATRGQILAAQALEYLLLAVILAALAAAIGIAGAWYVVVELFAFDWLPDYGAIAATLAVGVGVTVGIGLLGALPILSARPARALREL
ncbi:MULTISPECIES: ABC transporter permease [Sphingomonas]|jgi:putative ABC transport system permease protein|uniref:ABC transporter permease n=1 Tax=Sphingomonas hankookensis TaxID=563996 RepID=A0ABR5YG24_9SPHN|nr:MULTISPECIES: FtsX-like permease family protein [Sphingomonas]KZE17727.1 ABC transporter permease [Sphingomonas hankookensis]PZT95848.1 MAG: ABC transporter permease [Sphingomonas sp.]RSV28691.1 ABC transporter permease [Sphingomonas sp. ABOLH]